MIVRTAGNILNGQHMTDSFAPHQTHPLSVDVFLDVVTQFHHFVLCFGFGLKTGIKPFASNVVSFGGFSPLKLVKFVRFHRDSSVISM